MYGVQSSEHEGCRLSVVVGFTAQTRPRGCDVSRAASDVGVASGWRDASCLVGPPMELAKSVRVTAENKWRSPVSSISCRRSFVNPLTRNGLHEDRRSCDSATLMPCASRT
jgi:hypothetical protein